MWWCWGFSPLQIQQLQMGGLQSAEQRMPHYHYQKPVSEEELLGLSADSQGDNEWSECTDSLVEDPVHDNIASQPSSVGRMRRVGDPEPLTSPFVHRLNTKVDRPLEEGSRQQIRTGVGCP